MATPEEMQSGPQQDPGPNDPPADPGGGGPDPTQPPVDGETGDLPPIDFPTPIPPGTGTGVDFTSASAMMQSMLKQWGLDTLSDKALELLRGGLGVDYVTLQLQNTDEYKQRFAANDARVKAGLPALSPAEYIANEKSYMDVMRTYGMPAGFYDNRDDFRAFLEKDVSPQELQSRVSEAADRYLNAAPEVRDQFARAGYQNPGQVIASLLDPNRALPIIKNEITSYGIAAEAARAFGDTNKLDLGQALTYAQQGVTAQQARTGFGELAGREQRDLFLGRMNDVGLSEQGLQNEVLLGDKSQAALRTKAYQGEEAQFKQNYQGQQTGLVRSAEGQF